MNNLLLLANNNKYDFKQFDIKINNFLFSLRKYFSFTNIFKNSDSSTTPYELYTQIISLFLSFVQTIIFTQINCSVFYLQFTSVYLSKNTEQVHATSVSSKQLSYQYFIIKQNMFKQLISQKQFYKI